MSTVSLVALEALSFVFLSTHCGSIQLAKSQQTRCREKGWRKGSSSTRLGHVWACSDLFKTRNAKHRCAFAHRGCQCFKFSIKACCNSLTVVFFFAKISIWDETIKFCYFLELGFHRKHLSIVCYRQLPHFRSTWILDSEQPCLLPVRLQLASLPRSESRLLFYPYRLYTALRSHVLPI